MESRMEIEYLRYNGFIKFFSSTKIPISYFFSELFWKFPFNLHADDDDNNTEIWMRIENYSWKIYGAFLFGFFCNFATN